jgi:hypothetical protein
MSGCGRVLTRRGLQIPPFLSVCRIFPIYKKQTGKGRKMDANALVQNDLHSATGAIQPANATGIIGAFKERIDRLFF